MKNRRGGALFAKCCMGHGTLDVHPRGVSDTLPNIVELAENDRNFLLRVVQPGLAGLMDGSVSTLAPIFATAFATKNSHTVFLIGAAAARPSLRVLRRRAHAHPLRQHEDRGGEDPGRHRAAADPSLLRTAESLPFCRQVRTSGQGQRQGQGGRTGRVSAGGSTRISTASIALCSKALRRCASRRHPRKGNGG